MRHLVEFFHTSAKVLCEGLAGSAGLLLARVLGERVVAALRIDLPEDDDEVSPPRALAKWNPWRSAHLWVRCHDAFDRWRVPRSGAKLSILEAPPVPS